jgi:hypothetical protein
MNMENRLLHAYQQQLDLLKQCRQLLQEKTISLMTNNLTQLEKSVEAEAFLQIALSEQEKKIQACKRTLADLWHLSPEEINWRTLTLRCKGEVFLQAKQLQGALRSMTDELRALTQKNLALIRNGQLFAETMLSAICPAPTYHPDMGGKSASLPSRLSLNC